MTGMAGSAGILKADWKAESYNHDAASVRIDDIINGRFRDVPVCMVKADVEGYEPQVLQTARRLLTRKRVPALQLELTRTPKTRNQTCAMVKTLAHLADGQQAGRWLPVARRPRCARRRDRRHHLV